MSDRDTEGEQGKEMQLNKYAACFKLNSEKKRKMTQATSVCVGNTARAAMVPHENCLEKAMHSVSVA